MKKVYQTLALTGLSLIHSTLFADSITTFQLAQSVIGQQSFTTNLAGAPASTSLSQPSGVAVDPLTGKLFVADRLNNRVLRYTSINAYASGQGAELVFGQASLMSGAQQAAAANTMFHPEGVGVDSVGRLYVADTDYNRVLRFDNASAIVQNAPMANCVFGQPDSATSTAGINNVKLDRPRSVVVGANHLWVADTNNNRVVGYANPGAANTGDAAVKVFGQAALNTKAIATTSQGMSGPEGVTISVGGATPVLWVSDSGNHRVLRFVNPAMANNGSAASRVLGQATFNMGAAPNNATAANFYSPQGLAVDESDPLSVSLWVVDRVQSRILRFDHIYGPDGDVNTMDDLANNADASVVLGQANLTSSGSSVTQRTFDFPFGVTVDPFSAVSPRTIWVADKGNNRVLRFTPQPPPPPAPPVVLGKAKYKTTKSSLKIRGSAVAGVPITLVIYKGKKGGFRPAAGTNSWSFKAKCQIGKNRFAVIARDALGRQSAPKSITVKRL